MRLTAAILISPVTGEDPTLFRHQELKPLRAALHPLVLEQMKNYAMPEGVASKQGAKRGFKRAQEMDREFARTSLLRQKRMDRLEQLNNEQDADVPRVPDGVALTDGTDDVCARRGAQMMLTDGPGAAGDGSLGEGCLMYLMYDVY